MASSNPMMQQPNMSSLTHPVGTTATGIPNETSTTAPAAQPPKRKQVKNACSKWDGSLSKLLYMLTNMYYSQLSKGMQEV